MNNGYLENNGDLDLSKPTQFEIPADGILTAQEAETILQHLASVFLDSTNHSLASALIGKEPKTTISDGQDRLAEIRYRTLVEQIPVVTFMAPFDGGLDEIYVSPQIEALLGYSQQEWTEDPILWYERLHPDDKERWNIEFAQTLIEDKPFRSVYRFIARDGRVVWVHGEGKIVRDEDGQPPFIQGIGYDVTELKEAVEAKTLLAEIVESSADAIIGETLKGIIMSWNPGAERVYGYSSEEVIGKPITILLPPNRPDEATHILETIRGGARVTHYETVHRTKDGSQIDVSLTVSPIKNGEGEIVRASTIARDITERAQAERKLRKFAAELERSNRELQDFAYIASHDLQEPLRKIQAFGSRLAAKYAEALGDEGRDYIERMQNSAKRMQSLVQDLLVFSRVTTRAQPFVQVNLKQVAREVVSDLEARIHQTGGRVEVGDLPTIDADPLQMRQLLQNLVGNALKFHRPGETPLVKIFGRLINSESDEAANSGEYSLNGTLGATNLKDASLVTAEPVTAKNGVPLCQLFVQDNGIGFDEKYLDRIFIPFERLHGRDAYDGTGIGLAICRKIVVRHGGSITARSTPGQGATFIVTLPRYALEQPEGESAPNAP